MLIPNIVTKFHIFLTFCDHFYCRLLTSAAWKALTLVSGIRSVKNSISITVCVLSRWPQRCMTNWVSARISFKGEGNKEGNHKILYNLYHNVVHCILMFWYEWVLIFPHVLSFCHPVWIQGWWHREGDKGRGGNWEEKRKRKKREGK